MVSAVVFLISGILFVSYSPAQIVLDYTTCSGKSFQPPDVKYTGTSGPGISTTATNCTLNFTIEKDSTDVLIYYNLNNFYQNHRKYVRSKSDDQLAGKAVSSGTVALTCDPLATDSASGKIIYPCGLIANSQFNDVLNSLTDSNGNNIPLKNTGIAWSSDKDRYLDTQYTADQIIPPPNWQFKYDNGQYTKDTIPKLHTDEDFQVWMRVAPFSSFNKLWRRVDSLKKGDYTLNIFSRYDILTFGGQKKVLITSSSVLGDSTYLGYMYVGTGVVCLILGLSFLIKHKIHPRYLIVNIESLVTPLIYPGISKLINCNIYVILFIVLQFSVAYKKSSTDFDHRDYRH